MKRVVLVIILLIFIVGCERSLQELQYCEFDSDCIVVPGRTCSCDISDVEVEKLNISDTNLRKVLIDNCNITSINLKNAPYWDGHLQRINGGKYFCLAGSSQDLQGLSKVKSFCFENTCNFKFE